MTYWLCGISVTTKDGKQKKEVIPFVWKIDKQDADGVAIYSDQAGHVVIHKYLSELVKDVKIFKREMVHGF